MEKTISLANSMPLTFGLIAGGFVASYWLSGLQAEFEIGRPSSTAALGYMFVPVYAGLAALGGGAVGLIAKSAIKGFLEPDRINKRKFYLVAVSLLVLSCLLASYLATQSVVAFEESNKPQQISNRGNFEKVQLARGSAPSVENHAQLTWDFSNKGKPAFPWSGFETRISVENDTVLKIRHGNVQPIEYDVRQYSYITEVANTIYTPNDGKAEYLVLLVKLRATSFRSLLLIYNQKHELVYEELLGRCGRTQYMGTSEGIEGEEIIVSICSPFSITEGPNK